MFKRLFVWIFKLFWYYKFQESKNQAAENIRSVIIGSLDPVIPITRNKKRQSKKPIVGASKAQPTRLKLDGNENES